MIGYYDYVLGFIPFALFGVTGLLSVAGLGWSRAILLGAGVALLAVGHALFVNGPVDDEVASPTPSSQTQAHHAPSNPVSAD